MLPGGVDPIGVFGSKNVSSRINPVFNQLKEYHIKQKTENVKLIFLMHDSVCGSMICKDSTGESCDYATETDESETPLLSNILMIRLTANVEIRADKIDAALASLSSERAVFCHLDNATGAIKKLVRSTNGDALCADLFDSGSSSALPSASSTTSSGKKSGKAAASTKSIKMVPHADAGQRVPQQLRLVWSQKGDGSDAPILSYRAVAKTHAPTPVILDVLCLVPPDATLAQALALLQGRAARQVAAMADLQATLAVAAAPVARHFGLAPYHPFPAAVLHALPPPAAIGSGSGEEADAERRLGVHRAMLLPLDRPFVRAAQALAWGGGDGGAGLRRLINVHEGLAGSGLKGGQTHLVQGCYEYCHYMQDKFDDDGWGCMYRSYQTVLSWFRLQHYTSLPIQSHEEIQRMLVKMGDKPERFVGSKQWIGAMEVPLLLDQYLGVSCKIINVSSGADLQDKGRELAQHFETEGTPVCVGGGVLAFTLLGVHFYPEAGQTRFLLLDPHYTGSEDLATIQNTSKKNACSGICSVGWHDASVFRADSFYNLALPQRPRCI